MEDHTCAPADSVTLYFGRLRYGLPEPRDVITMITVAWTDRNDTLTVLQLWEHHVRAWINDQFGSPDSVEVAINHSGLDAFWDRDLGSLHWSAYLRIDAPWWSQEPRTVSAQLACLSSSCLPR